MSDAAQPLKDLEPQHEFFVGIDSDGCAFDTMENTVTTPSLPRQWVVIQNWCRCVRKSPWGWACRESRFD